jgi:hypothetical protein
VHSMYRAWVSAFVVKEVDEFVQLGLVPPPMR